MDLWSYFGDLKILGAVLVRIRLPPVTFSLAEANQDRLSRVEGMDQDQAHGSIESREGENIPWPIVYTLLLCQMS